MHKIKLVSDKPFHNNCDVTVYDMTMGEEKKRCKIKVEYAKCDVEELKEQGMDKATTLDYFNDWIYKIVKMYISDDWECTGGLDEIIEIIDDHIDQYFK